MNAMMIWDNPLVIRGIRTRLRLPLLLSWGLITIVAAAFLYIGVYGNAIKVGNTTPQEAAREAILPLLVMQGIILMVLGTGSVAGGMARERTYGLLDYQRLTPMSPSAKIVGLLVGLPIREYFMFALSLPFVFYAAWVGGLSFGVLLKFYLVFLSSAVVYHMTGLTAGMVVGKPWQAGTLSQGLVVVLYLILPQISRVGFTFFEFLTARPVFYGMVNQHLMPDGLTGIVQSALADHRYTSVWFFGMRLSPVFFSLAVQAYAMVSLYVIVYRKWQSEDHLPFSKGYALLFFAIAQLFLAGSIQPFLHNDRLFEQLAAAYGEADKVRRPQRVIVFAIFLTNLTVSGCAAMLTLYLCTPNWFRSITGLRRAVRRGATRLAWTDDAAPGLPVAAACILMSWLGFFAVYQTAFGAGRVDADNPAIEIVMPLLFFAAVLVTVQQVIEQFSERVFVMAMFIFWIVPFLAGIIVATVFDRPVAGMYTVALFPFTDLWFAASLLISDQQTSIETDVLPLVMQGHASPASLFALLLYAVAAMLLLLRARRRWQRIRVEAGAVSPAAGRQAIAVPTEDPPGGVPVPVYAEDGPASLS